MITESTAARSQDAVVGPTRGSRWLAYLRLFRAPNVFTAISDVSMGYLVTTQGVSAWSEFGLLIAASSCLYTSGMVLNDVFDFEVDQRERPQRPLPSGQISRAWAKGLGWCLLLVGLALAWLAGIVSRSAVGPWWRAGVVGSLLAAAIVWYNSHAKRTPSGPIVMGFCRFSNILMGMSLHAVAQPGSAAVIGYGGSHLLIAAGIGIYIVGVTVFARSEATTSPRGPLLLGIAIMVGGIALLAVFPSIYPAAFRYTIEPATLWPLAVAVISVWILRRCAAAVYQPQPRRVQSAIKFCLMSLIVLDATLCLLVCPAAYAVAVIALLIPMLVLGRWVYST